VTNIYKNKHEMIMIVKIFGTYVSSGNLGLSSRKVCCSSGKLPFSQGTIMSPGRKSLSCLGEQFKPFFPPKNNHVLGEKEFVFLQKHSCSLKQFKFYFFENMVVP
jgi:hypothetical protein